MKGVYGRKSGGKDAVCYKSRETEPGTTKEPSKFSACGAWHDDSKGLFLSSINSLPANNREQIKGVKRNPESYKHWTVCAFCCAGGLYRSRNSVCAACCLGLEKKKKEKKKKDYASHRLLGRRGQELKVKRCCCCIVDSLLLSSFFFFLLKAHFWLVLTAVWWFYLVFMCLYIYIHDVYNDRDKHTNIQTSACMCGQLWVASDGLVACPLERRGSVKKSLFLAILFSPLDCCSTLGDMGSPEKKCCFAFDSKTSQMASLPTNVAAELTTQVSFN